MSENITLYSAGGKITFGREGFILHEIEIAPPKIRAGVIGVRHITVCGYILPSGEEDAARRASLQSLTRRVMRLVTAEDGFFLEEGNRILHLYAAEAPDFSREAPFAEGDAACFTLRALTSEDDPFFTAENKFVAARGMEGKLIFPLTITGNTVMATLSRQGEILCENPGDVPCGFTLSVQAEDGPLTSLKISLGDEYLHIDYPLQTGEILTVCTVPGQKNVYSGGRSILSAVDWSSTFFSLPVGDNRIHWQAEGEGYPRLTLHVTPLYL